MGWTRTTLVSALVLVLAIIAVKVYPNLPSGRVGVLFYALSGLNPERTEFSATADGVSGLSIDETTPVTIIIHGYTESSFRSWITRITNSLLRMEDGGVVILVDYWDMTTISRPYMSENCKTVARETTKLLELLVTKKGMRFSNVHVMGFSLGGRIAGILGNMVKPRRIARITGIDPSYPWKPTQDIHEYLDPSDAEMVVTIRSSPVATSTPPTHIDFYANDGLSQPGCEKWYYPGFVSKVCSHYRAATLLVEAVENASERMFPACSCPSWEEFSGKLCDCQTINHFGLFPDPRALGSFYFTTNPEPPYSRPLQ